MDCSHRNFQCGNVISLLMFLSLIIFTCTSAFAQELSSPVTLEADEVVFFEIEGRAEARGNVIIRREDMKLEAPYVEYFIESSMVFAEGHDDELVVLIWGNRVLRGDKLEYNLITQEGIMQNGSGQEGPVYVYGGDVKIAPPEAALTKGWLGRKDLEKTEKNAHVAIWENANYTTCDAPKPHYNLYTTKMTVIPGNKVVLRRPRVYLDGKLLYTYPFNYEINIRDREASSPFTFRIKDDSDRGTGVIGYGPVVVDDRLSVNVHLAYWSDMDEEWMVLGSYGLTNQWSLFANAVYAYNSDEDEKRYRPSWGANYYNQGFSGKIYWSQAENVSIEKEAGVTYKGVLWRSPEVQLFTPWVDLTSNARSRLALYWGHYEADEAEVDRWGYGFDFSSSFAPLDKKNNNFTPFIWAQYQWFKYDAKKWRRQEIIDATWGLRYRVGEFPMVTRYAQRWTTGNSPMSWDDYSDRREIYHTTGIPLGSRWKVAVRTAYDFVDEHLDEVVYSLVYDEHCYYWEFIYKDERPMYSTSDEDDWMGLRLVIKAFPESKITFGGEVEEIRSPAQEVGFIK